MSAPTRRRTPPPDPDWAYSQDQLRDRRRHWLPVRYGGDFSLLAEIAAIVTPLAQRVAAEPASTHYRTLVDDVADKTHEVLSFAVAVIAETEARAKTQHLAGAPGKRSRAITALVDLTQRPPEPKVTTDMLISGAWAALLVSHVEPFSTGLAGALARAVSAPDDAQGDVSLGSRLETELRELDSVALTLSRRLDEVARHRADKQRAEYRRRQQRTPTPEEQRQHVARATLRELGITEETTL